MVTINQNPRTYSPVYNPVVYVVTSDKSTQANFNFIADIYITGVTFVGGVAYLRQRYPAHPTLNSAKIDISSVVRNFIDQNIDTTQYGFVRNSSGDVVSYRKVQVKFGEEFGSSSSGTTIYANQVTSSDIFCWNAGLDWLTFNGYLQNDYVFNTSGTTTFLSNKPSSIKIRSDENAWEYLATSASNSPSYMKVETFNSAGGLIQTVKVTNNYSNISSSDDNRFLRFTSGTRNLNSISGGDITAGAQPIITASVVEYTVQAFNTANDPVSEQQTYVISDDCTEHTVRRLHFLNELGGFDSFSFIRLSTENVDIKRTQYKKMYGTQTATGWSYNKSESIINNVNTELRDKLILNSDWITEDESAWLEELLSSPVIYLDDPTHGLVSVVVTDTTWENQKFENKKLFNATIHMEYSFDRGRQML